MQARNVLAAKRYDVIDVMLNARKMKGAIGGFMNASRMKKPQASSLASATAPQARRGRLTPI